MRYTAVTAIAICISLTQSAAAADILVPQDAPTIQAGIDLTSSGDRVLVAPGTYLESINFSGKNITVESTDGAELTIIDGGGALGYVVSFTSGETQDAVLRGFTITGGFGQSGSAGGGMLINNASPVVEDSIIRENTALLGGGVKIVGGSPLFRDTLLLSNQALQGGGLYVESADLTVENSVFDGNIATGFGGAMAIFWMTNASVTDTTFLNNIVVNAGLGGAVYANSATLDFARLDFIENGKIEQSGYNSYIISTGGGGGIYTTGTNGRIDSSRFLRNIASFGTGLYIAGSGTLEVVNTLIAENGADCACGQGAVYANASSPSLINNTIVGNGGFFGVFTTYNAFPTVANTIIADMRNSIDSQSPTAGNGVTTLSYSLLQGQPASAELGEGNIIISGLPMLDASADYAPLSGSPAIDAGDNAAVPDDITTDLLGNDRFFDALGGGAIVDIGAVEFGSAPPDQALLGDMNGDGTVGHADLAMLLAAWGSCPPGDPSAGDDCGDCPADLKGDCVVDQADLAILLSNWQG